MRFKRTEVSPAGKKQYLIALGRIDIELLLGEAVNAKRYTPKTDSTEIIHQHLKGIIAGLKSALEVAKADNDEGNRLPWVERKPAALLRQDGHQRAEGTPAGEGENTSELA